MANVQGDDLLDEPLAKFDLSKQIGRTAELNFDLVERAKRTADLLGKWEQDNENQKFATNILIFGRYISTLRQQQNLTRQALSEQANVDPESLFLLEKGLLTLPEIESLLSQIASFLQTTVNDLQWELTATLGYES